MVKQSHASSAKKGQGDWHVSHTSMGMGDYYGSGIRAKIGKVVDSYGGSKPITPNSLKKAPKSLA